VTHALPNLNRTLAIALAAILLFGALVSVRTANAAESPTLTVMEQTVDIDYGKKITISVKIDTGATPKEIHTVRTLFKPDGGKTIWSYLYPTYANTNNNISLTFEIPTGPGSYYPPGVEFDIKVEIAGADGVFYSVNLPDKVEYLDPDEDWQRVTGNGYTVVYYGVSRSRVEELVETIDHRIPTLQTTLGVTETPDFKAIVYPSIQAATPSFPPVSQTATDSNLFAGFAQTEYRLFVQGQMNSTTFTHELAHLYTHEAVSDAFVGGLPSWLNEGLARFLETGSSESSNNRLRSQVQPNELLSLSHMASIPGQSRDVFIFYPQAGAIVGYIVEEFGHDKMAEYLAAINTGGTINAAFKDVYGKSIFEVENNWRADFGAAPLPITEETAEATDSTDVDVPLVGFEPATTGTDVETSAGSDAGSGQSAPTAVPNPLPTVTPEFSMPEFPGFVEEKPEPNWLVAGIVIGLSIIIGVWLFISRRRMPKPKT